MALRVALCGMFAFLADNILTSALVPVLPDFSSRLSLSYFAIGVVLSVRSIVQLCHSLFVVGPLIRKFGARNIFLYGLVVEVVTCIVTANASSLAILIVAQCLHGIGGSCFYTGGITQIIVSSPDTSRGRMLGIFFSGFAWGTLFGSLIGGSMYSSVGLAATFYFIACIMAVVLFTSLYILKSHSVSGNVTPVVNVCSLIKVASDRRILNSMAIIASSNACVGTCLVLFPSYMQSHFGMAADVIGYYMMIGPAVYLLTAHFAGWLTDKLPRYYLGAAGLSIIAISFLCCGIGEDTIYRLIIIYAVVFGACSFSDVSQPGAIASFLDEHRSDGVYMLGVALGDVSVSVGYALMVYESWMVGQIGFQWQLNITSIWLFFLVLVTLANFSFFPVHARPTSLEGLVQA